MLIEMGIVGLGEIPSDAFLRLFALINLKSLRVFYHFQTRQ